MLWDEEGFPYPQIDEKCVDCGECLKVCPCINELQKYGCSLDEASVFAAWSNSENRRIESTSGGVFSELALSVYAKGGVVAGAVYDEDFMIHHITSEEECELSRLRQSKYAQSDMKLVYREVKQFLRKGRLVLFCGTPCQAAGLRGFLGSVPDGLLLCDFICRGINSPKAYSAYIKMLEGQYGSKIANLHFKNKDRGWNQFQTKVTFENGSVYQQDRYHDSFMRAYLKYNLTLRPSCYSCGFKGNYRNVDVTLGDFWGVGKYDPELDDNKGTSVVLLHTDKGRSALAALGDKMVQRQMKVDHIYSCNPCLSASVSWGKMRNRFFANLDTIGFEKAARRYCRQTVIGKLSGFVSRMRK